jgi:hypothetical protein
MLIDIDFISLGLLMEWKFDFLFRLGVIIVIYSLFI